MARLASHYAPPVLQSNTTLWYLASRCVSTRIIPQVDVHRLVVLVSFNLYHSHRSMSVDLWISGLGGCLLVFIPQVDVHRLVGYYCNICNPRVDGIRLVVSTDLDSFIPQVDVHRLVGYYCNVCNPRVDVIRLAVFMDLDSHHSAGRITSTRGLLLQRYL
jgi:hypothetical protein